MDKTEVAGLHVFAMVTRQRKRRTQHWGVSSKRSLKKAGEVEKCRAGWQPQDYGEYLRMRARRREPPPAALEELHDFLHYRLHRYLAYYLRNTWASFVLSRGVSKRKVIRF
jgi:hypothetical protein